MPRIRTIKPNFFKSEDVSALPLRARLTWIGLWTQCDDAGRTKDNVRLIKAELWPLDNVSLRDVEDDLDTLAEHGRIVRYEVDGKPYLEVANWGEHQNINRPSTSTYPAPPAKFTDDSVRAHGRVTEDSPGERKGKERKGTKKTTSSSRARAPARTAARQARGTRIPDDFAVTAAMDDWAQQRCPHVDTSTETEKFLNYWQAKSGQAATKLDWVATWRNWMLNAAERAPIRGSPPPGQPQLSTTDQRVLQAQQLKYTANGQTSEHPLFRTLTGGDDP